MGVGGTRGCGVGGGGGVKLDLPRTVLNSRTRLPFPERTVLHCRASM